MEIERRSERRGQRGREGAREGERERDSNLEAIPHLTLTGVDRDSPRSKRSRPRQARHARAAPRI